MGDEPVSLDIRRFYDRHATYEWERLDQDLHHRLEWENTVAYLERELPAGARVLDVGGGAGRYAVWLAERGHEVTLLDLSEGQVRLARGKATEHGVTERVSVATADVRRLPVRDDTAPATLCLGGALSHVLDAEARERAVGELRRVTAPGGPVLVSVMGRLASITRMLRALGRSDEADEEAPLLPELLRDGTYDADLLARHGLEPQVQQMHLFRAAEFESLLEAGGLSVEQLVGLEGLFSQRREELARLDDDQRELVREVVTETREDRSVVDHSGHMLAVCRA